MLVKKVQRYFPCKTLEGFIATLSIEIMLLEIKMLNIKKTIMFINIKFRFALLKKNDFLLLPELNE